MQWKVTHRRGRPGTWGLVFHVQHMPRSRSHHLGGGGGAGGLNTPLGLSTLCAPAGGPRPCAREDEVGVTDSSPQGSLAMSTAAPTSCATAEDVESLGSPRGCPSGLNRWVYAGCTPAASISSTSSCNISRPPSSLHALSITRTAACRQPRRLSGTSELKGLQRSNSSLQSCIGTRMLFAKWRPSVYAATRLSSVNGSRRCSCSPWHAIVRQLAAPGRLAATPSQSALAVSG